MIDNLCIETMCVRDGKIRHLDYHQGRLDRTRAELWGFLDACSLDVLQAPAHALEGVFKCRVTYGEKIEEVIWAPHVHRDVRTLRIIRDDRVDYSYKYNLRPELTKLYEQRGDADEILMIKQGLVSDAYYYNVAFQRDGQWFTPDSHLLPGTQRAYLLDTGVLTETRIEEKDLSQYSHIKLINALNDWNAAPQLPISAILQ